MEPVSRTGWEGLKKGSKVKILRGKYEGEEGFVNNWYEEEDGEASQVDVLVPTISGDNKMRYFEFDDLKLID